MCTTIEFQLASFKVNKMTARADRKYEVFTAAAGLPELDPAATDEEKERVWGELSEWERDAPLHRSSHGVLESLRQVTSRGLPELAPR